ncbi:MAG: DUF192 domain-containing protein [Parcubacteria group bacterium]
MSKNRLITFVACFIVVFIVIIFTLSTQTYSSRLVLGGRTFSVEIADTKNLTEKGLSGHAPLAFNEGMFFAFKDSDVYGFWMKEMLFPIDIIWIDKDFRIVHIEKEVKPETYPKVFYPSLPAMYVLEISSGESDKLGLQIGDPVRFVKKFF